MKFLMLQNIPCPYYNIYSNILSCFMFWHPGTVLTFCLDTKRFKKIKAVLRRLPANFGVAVCIYGRHRSRTRIIAYFLSINPSFLPFVKMLWAGCAIPLVLLLTLWDCRGLRMTISLMNGILRAFFGANHQIEFN